jgi:glutaredoxin
MEPYRVYWQPGCTSCLKAKEFLASHGIAFESINVRAQPGAMEELARLGARSVPVIARGDRFCFGQELEEVARFIGLPWRRERLPVATLFERLQRLLSAAERLASQLPERAVETPIEGRPDRSFGDLGYHIAMIVEGFLAAARGEQLTFAYFERRPIGAARAPAAVATRIAVTAAAFSSWYDGNAEADPDRSLDTYYGAQPLHGVLERTVWHAAQHCRQLEHIVLSLGIESKARLGDAELSGLPLPVGIWDKEIEA